jgi:hypothetical protein
MDHTVAETGAQVCQLALQVRVVRQPGDDVEGPLVEADRKGSSKWAERMKTPRPAAGLVDSSQVCCPNTT